MSNNDYQEEPLSSGKKDAGAGQQPKQPQFDDSVFGGAPASESGNPMAFLSGLTAVTATGNTASGNTAEALKAFNEARERTVNVPNALKVKVSPVEDARMYISFITISLVSNGVLYYVPYLLEAISKPIPVTQIPGPGGRPIDVEKFTTAYWDRYRQDIVEGTLLSAEQNQNLRPVMVAAIVVPRSIDLTNANALAPFYDYGIAALQANIRAGRGQAGSDITAAMLVNKAITVVAKFDITPGRNYKSTTGQPLVADFNAVMYARSASSKPSEQKAVPGGNEDVALTSIMGYFDFVRRDEPAAGGQYFPMGGMQRPVPGYDPVLVITQNTTLGNTSVPDSVLTQLLALPTVLPLIDPATNKWATVFEPFVNEGTNKATIGALALEHNLYPGTQFTPTVLNVVPNSEVMGSPDKVTAQQVIQTYCTDRMIVALDILQGGPLEWVQSLLAKAVPGSEAEKTIIGELDHFSGNLFGDIWLEKKQPILATRSTDLFAGYYVDPEGNNRDIRSIDYLSVLLSTEGNRALFDPFAVGFLPGMDNEVMMDQKRSILKQIVPNAVITGVYTRIFLNNAFISAIDEMMSKCGLKITVEGLMDMGVGAGIRQSFNSDYLQPIRSSNTYNFYSQAPAAAPAGHNRYASTAGLAAGYRGRHS